jgi:hypothetical protein
MPCIFGWPLSLNGAKYAVNGKYIRKIYYNRKLFEIFELFDKKVRNYSLFDKFLNHYLNPSLKGDTDASILDGVKIVQKK